MANGRYGRRAPRGMMKPTNRKGKQRGPVMRGRGVRGSGGGFKPRRGVRTQAASRSNRSNVARNRSNISRGRAMPPTSSTYSTRSAGAGMNGIGSIGRNLGDITPDGLLRRNKLVTPDIWIDTAKFYNQMLKNAGFGPNRFGYIDFRGHFTPGQLKHNGALGSQNQEH